MAASPMEGVPGQREGVKGTDLCHTLALWKEKARAGNVSDLQARAWTSYPDVDVHLGYDSSMAMGSCSMESMLVPRYLDAGRSSIAWPCGTPA